jgi:hypothetical protein
MQTTAWAVLTSKLSQLVTRWVMMNQESKQISSAECSQFQTLFVNFSTSVKGIIPVPTAKEFPYKVL